MTISFGLLSVGFALFRLPSLSAAASAKRALPPSRLLRLARLVLGTQPLQFGAVGLFALQADERGFKGGDRHILRGLRLDNHVAETGRVDRLCQRSAPRSRTDAAVSSKDTLPARLKASMSARQLSATLAFSASSHSVSGARTSAANPSKRCSMTLPASLACDTMSRHSLVSRSRALSIAAFSLRTSAA
jgi:hypothetical protein